MRKIKLDARKTVGVSGSGRRIGSEKTGTTEKELVEAPTRKPIGNGSPRRAVTPTFNDARPL